jgi:hypothetical protein
MSEAREIAKHVLDPFYIGPVDGAYISPVGSVDSERLRSGTAPADWDQAPDAHAIAEAAIRGPFASHEVTVVDDGGHEWPPQPRMPR